MVYTGRLHNFLTNEVLIRCFMIINLIYLQFNLLVFYDKELTLIGIKFMNAYKSKFESNIELFI